MTKVLSLDTSSSSTGWAVFVNGKYESSGCIDLKKIKDSKERMKEMVFSIQDLLNSEQPDIVYVELTSVARNVSAQRTLTMILGAIWAYCINHDIYYEAFRPTEWRSWVKYADEKLPRRREELKQWSICRVKELFGIDVQDDTSDAILLGLGAIYKYTT